MSSEITIKTCIENFDNIIQIIIEGPSHYYYTPVVKEFMMDITEKLINKRLYFITPETLFTLLHKKYNKSYDEINDVILSRMLRVI